MTCHKSQEARILELLLRARGGWVPAPELAAVSLQYNTRAYSLRRLGLAIENRVETNQDGTKNGFFRLRTGSPCRPDGAAPAEVDESLPLLANLQPEARYPN
jgi:hypothetical protein